MVDSKRLPLQSPVRELEQLDGKTRVVFERMASIYYLEDTHPEHARILEALERSRRTGEPVQLFYALPHKTITALGDE